MCGICGFTGAQRGNAADARTLKAMCDIIAHRGPDGEGQYIDDGIALGHRRLSLIDLEGGNQPMVRATGEHAAAVTSPALGPDGQPREGAAAAETRGEWAIVFNGEIYNYRELRAELQEQGWEFQRNSDTEVLLVGYIAWGEAVLQRLRGMFAFAIWNRTSGELFCARDFFGIKPFYYTVVGDAGDEGASVKEGAGASSAAEPAGRRFIFASETKSILEHPAYERRLNEQALAAYLCFQFNPLQETFFAGIYKLPQGHWMRVSADGSLTIQRYWQPRYNFDEQRTQEQTVQAIDRAIRESVHYHNVADVEVGSFLSSGIDSSYLAACLAKENPDIKTFTVGFAEYATPRGAADAKVDAEAGAAEAAGAGAAAEAEGAAGEGEHGAARDEISWAQELAGLLGVANESHHIDEQEYWQALPRVQWFMDEPSADPSAVALYFVDKLAAQSVKAVLSGEGADEFFGGYRIYQTPFSNEKLAWVPKGALHAGSSVLHKLGLRGANYLERASESVEDWYYTNANGVAFSTQERLALLAPDLRKRLEAADFDPAAAVGLPSHDKDGEGGRRSAESGLTQPQELTAPVYAEVADLDETTRMQYTDLWFWLVGDILLKTDKMSMAHSLESRVPFLDREVFELSATIPTRLKANGEQTKLTLREAAEQAIPHDWAQKEKLGFPVPVTAWLRQDRYYDQVKAAFTSPVAAQFFNTSELVRLLDEHRGGDTGGHAHNGARGQSGGPAREVRDNTRRIWIVYMFLVWYGQYFESEA